MAALTALFLFSAIGSSVAINCHYCAGVTDPHYCAEVVKCRQDEECFSDLVIGDQGHTFFNSGCRHKYVCNLIVKSLQSRKRNQLPVCEECCGKDQCNTGLCMEPRNQTKPDCYKCDAVDSPYDCHNKVICGVDEICTTEEFIDPNTFASKFKLGCEKQSRCDLLNNLGRKRETTTCIECCAHTGCNRHLCYDGPRPTRGSPPPGSMTTPLPLTGAAGKTTKATAAPVTAAPTTVQQQVSTSAAAQATPAVADCVDSTLVDCQELDSVSNICTDVTDATKLYCPKWCNICGQQNSAAAVTTTSQTVTSTAGSTTCTDSPIVNCTELDITTSICNPVTPATNLYCAGHCKLPC